MRFLTLLITAAILAASMSAAEARCGSRGGPGYRQANGKCAAWHR